MLRSAEPPYLVAAAMSDVAPHLFYANAAEVTLGPYDVAIKFMRNITPTSVDVKGLQPGQAGGVVMKDSNLNVADLMVVSMSLSHLKAMIPSLVAVIATYETQTKNTIPVPMEIAEVWDRLGIDLGKFNLGG